jgi:hypothetical protein
MEIRKEERKEERKKERKRKDKGNLRGGESKGCFISSFDCPTKLNFLSHF